MKKGNFNILPLGRYIIQVEQCEIKNTEKGKAIEMTMVFIDGPYKGDILISSMPYYE